MISIVIPAHNEEKALPATLHAIKVALSDANTFGEPVEVIVVDDDSTDQTAQLAKEWGAKVVSVKLRNIGAVRNAGAQAAVCRWLIFVDADTLVSAETFRATYDALREGAVGGGASVRIPDLDSLPWSKKFIYYAVVTLWQRFGKWAAGCYMFCVKQAFEDFGGFDENYFAAEEFFFSRELKRRGKFVVLDEPVDTSSRKLHAYSFWQLSRMVLRPMLTMTPLKSRTGLEILYEDRN